MLRPTYTEMNDRDNDTNLVIEECEDGNSEASGDEVEISELAEPDDQSQLDTDPPSAEKIHPQTSAVRTFIQAHIKPVLTRSAKNGQTTMSIACMKGFLPVVRHLFCTTNININRRDSEGNTALMLAAQGGHFDVIRFLLWSYEDICIDAENNFGITALMKTALSGHSNCARILIVAGADVEKRDRSRNYCAYEWAMLCGFNQTAKVIKSIGSAGPLHIQRQNERKHKETKFAVARNIYCEVKGRISRTFCGNRDNWSDEVGALFYLVNSSAHPSNVPLALGWKKLESHASASESLTELETGECSCDFRLKEVETDNKTFPMNRRNLKKYTSKNLPLILCTQSSPKARRKSKKAKDNAEKDLLQVPPRKFKTTSK